MDAVGVFLVVFMLFMPVFLFGGYVAYELIRAGLASSPGPEQKQLIDRAAEPEIRISDPVSILPPVTGHKSLRSGRAA